MPASPSSRDLIRQARSVGLEHEVGSLEAGKRADLAFWNVDTVEELTYWVGATPCAGTMKDGRMTSALI